jgi:uncharacterized protein (DUF697 family)
MLPGTIEELDIIRKDCLRMSRKRALLSAAVSVFPIPFTDIATDVVLLKQIIPKISEKFGLSKEQLDEYNPQIAIFIYDVSKRLGTHMIGKYVTKELIIKIIKKLGIRLTTRQLAKYIPILGQAVSAGLSFEGMRYIISSHINECYMVAKTVIESKSSS